MPFARGSLLKKMYTTRWRPNVYTNGGAGLGDLGHREMRRGDRMSGIGWEETLPVELWMDRETGEVSAVATLPRYLWLKALDLGLDREPWPLAVILARAVLEKAETECPRPLAEIAAEAGALIDDGVAALDGGTESGAVEA